MLKKTGIKNKQFELIQLIKRGQRMLHFRNIIDAVEHSCGNKPFNRLFKITRSAALADSSVHKLFVRFRKLCDNAAEYHEDASAVYFAIVFRKVILIDLKEFSLYP